MSHKRRERKSRVDVPTRPCHFCGKRRRCRKVRYPNLTFDVPVCAQCRRAG